MEYNIFHFCVCKLNYEILRRNMLQHNFNVFVFFIKSLNRETHLPKYYILLTVHLDITTGW